MKYFKIFFALVILSAIYWCIIVNIATNQIEESSYNYTMGSMYYNSNDQKKGDSCGVVARQWGHRSNKTLQLLPKLIRP